MMNHTFTKVSLLFLIVTSTFGSVYARQTDSLKATNKIWQNYEQYKEAAITNRLFKHADIVPLIQKHAATGLFKNEIAGKSVQGRSIHHLTAGKGKTKVLLWSQMHGDESTATMALFDLFNFLSADDQFNSFRKNILNKLELHFVPMLNPDGAEVWTRRNSMNIDINRDAQNLATPEANILMDLGQSIKPKYGFNLHDQSILYSVGDSKEPATISFLAPAFNKAKDMNEVRSNAVKTIVAMNKAIQTKIPGKVAKYDDTYDARCFGDQFQGMGISAILIESGGYLKDPEKQEIRKVNFYALITALEAIANQSVAKEDVNAYWAIPDNNRSLYDIIVRNVQFPGESKSTSLGIIRHQQIDTAGFKNINYTGVIAKVDDLDKSFGYEEVDATGLTFTTGAFGIPSKKKLDKANFMLYKDDRPVYIVINGFLTALK
jgi:hypothetical protein